MTKAEEKKYAALSARIASGEIADQKSWKMIRELNSFSEERLNSVAMIDCTRKYTYRQMFRQWERYAEVFSALNITGKNRSRAGMLSAPAVESTFAFYGLNMTGASVSMISMTDALNPEFLEKTIPEEGITDLLLTDTILQPELFRRLIAAKEELGLRNIIVLHWELTGPYVSRNFNFYSKNHYKQIKKIPGVVLMDDLLDQYEAAPILYGPSHSEEAALILHTSGTTSGIHKPIPHSDLGLNEAAARLLRDDRFGYLAGNARTFLGLDLSASFAMIDMLHLPLAFGGTVVSVPLGFYNSAAARAIKDFKINVLFAGGFLLPQMMHSPIRPDLSSIELCFVGGMYTSADKKRQYDEFLKKCGSSARITNGYGLSEAGAAVIVADPERTDDAIGYPLPGVKVKIYDEEEEKYYSLEDGPRTGVLFLSSPSVSSGKIDDKVFFTLDEINGEEYLNTYDLVTVNEDGSLSCIGRANKYFVNNEGVRFDAGLVETAVSAQPGIISCGLAPAYEKTIHDTIPVLYVHAEGNPAAAMRTVRQALLNVFIKENRIVETNLPGQCVITDHIPMTLTGKVDVHAIIKEGVKGPVYMVTPIRRQGKLFDIGLVPVPKKADNLAVLSGMPDELHFGKDLRQAVESFFPGLGYAQQNRNCRQAREPMHGPMRPPFFNSMRQGGGPARAPFFGNRMPNRFPMTPPWFGNWQQNQDAPDGQAYNDPCQYGLELVIQFLQNMIDVCQQMENMPAPGMGWQPPQGQQGFMSGDGYQSPQWQQGFMPGDGYQSPQGQQGFMPGDGYQFPQGQQGFMLGDGCQAPQWQQGFMPGDGYQAPQWQQGFMPGDGYQPPQGQQGFMPGDGYQPPQGQQGFMPGDGYQVPQWQQGFMPGDGYQPLQGQGMPMSRIGFIPQNNWNGPDPAPMIRDFAFELLRKLFYASDTDYFYED